ncbi:MAG TPA: Verru_Chthon cassette protein C [Chthoniobacteraceae bacterium]|jgi:uncharacterized protein (TIGR02599 family)|nr:Verru_Chthon cassette protein C [Chthoniobacteraceae bacterium]
MKRTVPAGFTLVELLAASTVVVIITGLLIGVLHQTGKIWQRTVGKAEQFREARGAFETITSRLAEATLNPYWDYDNANLPTKYLRRSELRFTSGPAEKLLGKPPDDRQWLTHGVFFQAPLGFTEVDRYRGYDSLCTWGYYLDLGDDVGLRPAFLTKEVRPARVRPRLYELWVPTEENRIYKFTSGAAGRSYSGRDWFRQPLAETPPPVHVLAENILALIILPRLAPADEAEVKGNKPGISRDLSPLSPDYTYDSSPVSASNPADSRHLDRRLDPVHQLPPLLQVSMVAVDEPSAARLGYTNSAADPLELSGKFTKSTDLSKELFRAGGADAVESLLIARHANYRIFTTNVVLRAAKWSREQIEGP